MSSAILTHSGRTVDPLAFRPCDVAIADIAAALSKVCRFNGHTREFYSVAQHSVLVSQHCGDDPRAQLRGLLHDGSEAYIADVTRPVKESPEFAVYRDIEAKIQCAINAHFGLLGDEAAAIAAVTDADGLMLAAEFRDLIPHAPAHWTERARRVDRIRPLYSERAELLFLRRFMEITGGRYGA